MSRKMTMRALTVVSGVLDGATVPEAARAAGVSTRQAYRYLAEEKAVTAMAAGQAQRIRLFATSLAGCLGENLRFVQQVRDDTAQPTTLRLRAAGMLDASARSWWEAVTLQQQVDSLREAIAELQLQQERAE